MLVWVGESSEQLRPLNSITRLQPLDSCHIAIIDSLEVGFTPSLKTIWSVLNKELCSALVRAGIERGEFINQIVEGSPQIVQNFSDKDRQFGGDREFRAQAPSFHLPG